MITTVQHVEFLSNKHYLEKNVWPVVSTALSASSSDRHAWLMTVLLLVNDRMQKATPSTVRDIWKINNSDDAEGVWSDVITSLLEDSYDGLTSHKNSSNTWTIREKSILAQFLIHVYANTDVDYIAKVRKGIELEVKGCTNGLYGGSISSNSLRYHYGKGRYPQNNAHWNLHKHPS